jgi:hypothetical protein
MRWAWLLVVVAVISGCELFSTRTPEPPLTSNTFIWTPATTVEALMTNFSGALSALDPTNYTRAFISTSDSGSNGKSFVFTATPGLSPSSQTVFANWSTESERAWLAKLATLVTKGSKLTVTFGNDAPVQVASTSATLTTTYTIAIPTPTGAVIPDTVRGSFEMQFILVSTEQGTKEWRIQSWSDFPQSGGTSATWTDLKLKLSS